MTVKECLPDLYDCGSQRYFPIDGIKINGQIFIFWHKIN